MIECYFGCGTENITHTFKDYVGRTEYVCVEHVHRVNRPRKRPTPSLVSQYRKMNDGVKGKRTPPRRLIIKGNQ